MKAKVSVVIPVYNSEKTLDRCLDSVINQTLKDLEIIVVDDGSLDNSLKILNEYSKKDSRIRVFSQKHMGQGIARNVGIENAVGDFIGFVDSDDTIDPKMYEILLNKIGNSQIIQCKIYDVYPNGEFVDRMTDFDCIVENEIKSEYMKMYIFKFIHSFECCNKLINAKFLKDNNIKFYSNDEVFAEDLLFNLELAINLDKIVFTNDILYNYYQHNDSHSKVKSPDRLGKLCRLFEIVYSKTSDRNLQKEISKLATLIIMLNVSHTIDKDGGYVAAKNVVKRKNVKKYIWESFLVMNKFHHKVIMLLILILPVFLKLKLIKLYYINMK